MGHSLAFRCRSLRIAASLLCVLLLSAACGSDSGKNSKASVGQALPEAGQERSSPADTGGSGALTTPSTESSTTDAGAGSSAPPTVAGAATPAGSSDKASAGKASANKTAAQPQRSGSASGGGSPSPGPASTPAATGSAGPSAVPGPDALRNADPGQGFTENELKIGLMCALSGPFAAVTKLGCYATQAIFQEVNASGGINGRKVKVILRDDQFAGPQGQKVIREFVEKDKVFLIDGAASPFGVVLSLNYISEKKVPVFSPGVFVSEYGNPYVFVNLPPTPIAGAHVGAPYLINQMGAKRVALVTHSEKEWDKAGQEFVYAAEQSGGQVVTVQKAPMDEVSYSAYVLNVQRANPDGVYLNLMPDGIIKWYLACKQLGYKPKTLGPPPGETELVPDGVGDYVLPYRTTTVLDPPIAGTPRYDRFMSAVTKYYPSEDWRTISVGTKQLYGMAVVLRESLKAMGPSLSRQKYVDLLNSRVWDSDGMTPPTKWEPTHRVPPFAAGLVTEWEPGTRTWKKLTEYAPDPWAERYSK